jgi:hypothetical protein
MPDRQDDWDWKFSLREDLTRVVEHYTTDRYPATQETQRAYEQRLAYMERDYSNDLDKLFSGERKQFDRDYAQQRLDQLNEQERQALGRARTPEDQLAIREGQRGERDALAHGDYRESNDYQSKLRQLGERQDADREQMDRAFRQVESGLNERFGFERDRDQDRGRER